ncbi:SDR family oxidoreductase [Aquabacterium sp. A7-Y]|uniref:SDR family NAD(P)-dependent oxidoreductase n=1 Tax=Aquabacterium sp. A7-Y TaxID=1349605 RepID=UPI00223DBF04|nr:SDR family oxidoreductase [Aquabacterium sp. A7-Y]MCW7536595.1 SDR family oxidoreductase [Aquabacterium sp. A7-Y]
MQLFKLDGKVAIVTGSSRGIGRSIAENLARCGARVVISSRKAPACEEVAAAIRGEGGDAIAIPANISSKTDLEHLVAETRQRLGPIDILVCNAATNPYYGPSTGISDEVFDKIMRNNVLSNLWLSNMVRPDMAAKRDGAIVIVSSIGGLHGSTSIGAYNVSKAADMQLARNLAVEWGPDNIRVNCIAPGVVETDFARALVEDPRLRNLMERELPLRRFGQPDDIGGIAVMLASAAGRYVTGQTIVADGGYMVR